MIEEIGAAVGSACVALGMRFEKPPIILDHENTLLEDLIQFAEHDISLRMQELLINQPSPWLGVIKGGTFPAGMGGAR